MKIGKIGVEIELMAPPGKSRRDLADAIAAHYGGSVSRFFHPQAEESKVANTPFFENLTLAFRVEDSQGNLLAQCVDDFTLQDDLAKSSPAKPDWYRIVSDDARFLRLAKRHFDATPLCSVITLSNVIRFLHLHGDAIKQHLGTNQHCRRLGSWPAELIELVNLSDFTF